MASIVRKSLIFWCPGTEFKNFIMRKTLRQHLRLKKQAAKASRPKIFSDFILQNKARNVPVLKPKEMTANKETRNQENHNFVYLVLFSTFIA